jgi:tetratricopeptide (TPR) repeat protein
MADAGTGSGQHKIIDIADILQSLGNKRWTGTLQVISHGRNVHLFVREGVIQHSKADASKVVLGRALFKLGKLDEADLNIALNDFETSGKKIGEACVELGLVKPEDIKEALAFQAREGVLDLFTWEDVDARFHPGEPPLPAVFAPDDLDVRINLSPMGLLMEAARRADEWEVVKQSLPTLDEVLASTQPDGAPQGGDRRLLALIDGYRTANEIADAAPFANFEALKQLADLVKAGKIRRLEAVELAKVALEAERDKDLEKALRLYELAQGRGLGDRIDLAKRIARVYQLLGKGQESLRQWLALGRRCEEQKNEAQAVEAYRAALAIDPVRVEVHERLAKLLVAQNRNEEASTQLRFLIENLNRQEARDLEKLVWAYEELLHLTPRDELSLRRLAELHVERGEKVQAIVRYDELAHALIGRGAREDAVAVYYKVLEIDEECLEGRLALAQCLADLGSTDDAVREYRRLADTLYRSGLIANSINWGFLIKVYESIVAIEPRSTPAWEWLAKAYFENGQTDMAISRYTGMADSLAPADEHAAPPPQIVLPLKRVIELDPKNTEIRRRLANAYSALNSTVEAVQTLHALAQTFVEAKDGARALETLDEVLHLDPFHIESRQLFAELTENAGDAARAFAAWSDLGVLCFRAGLKSEASTFFRRALAIRPEDPDVLWECARAEEARGKTTEAALLYGKLVTIEHARENAGRSKQAQERYHECSRLPGRSPSQASMPALVVAPVPPAPPISKGTARIPAPQNGIAPLPPTAPSPPSPPAAPGSGVFKPRSSLLDAPPMPPAPPANGSGRYSAPVVAEPPGSTG